MVFEIRTEVARRWRSQDSEAVVTFLLRMKYLCHDILEWDLRSSPTCKLFRCLGDEALCVVMTSSVEVERAKGVWNRLKGGVKRVALEYCFWRTWLLSIFEHAWISPERCSHRVVASNSHSHITGSLFINITILAAVHKNSTFFLFSVITARVPYKRCCVSRFCASAYLWLQSFMFARKLMIWDVNRATDEMNFSYKRSRLLASSYSQKTAASSLEERTFWLHLEQSHSQQCWCHWFECVKRFIIFLFYSFRFDFYFQHCRKLRSSVLPSKRRKIKENLRVFLKTF